MKKGDVFEEKFILSDHVYEGFIQIFRDRNPLHTDPDFAKSHGFNDKLMHGNTLNGFISYFVGECLPVKNVIIQTQSIQFASPVYLNDILDFNCEITDVFDSVQTIELRFYFKNKSGKKVARGNLQLGILS